MNKIVLTNNPKVRDAYADKAEIRFREGASTHEIYEEGKEIVQGGGKLIMDPTAGNIKNYYKSLVFMTGGEDTGISSLRSIELLDKCLEKTPAEKKGKEPVLAGIMQNKEIDILKRILS